MSDGRSIGSIVGGITGAIIGSYFGIGFQGFMIGSSLGGMVGNWLDPPDAPDPPPMGDLGVNTYVHNAPVPLAYGTCKVYGGAIWLGDVSVDVENDGSSKNPEYTYETDMWFAIAHCEGTVGSFVRYWVDDKEYEAYGQEGFYIVFTSYTGTNTQLVDSDIEEYQLGTRAPGIPFIYTAYTSVHVHVKNQALGTIPNISAEIKALLVETGEEDANPIRVLYDFLTNKRYGCGLDSSAFDGDCDTAGSSWKIAADYCDESVSYTDGDDSSTVNEARFRYSNVFDYATKGYDVVTDILSTCRGLLRYVNGELQVVIDTDSETPVHYYSEREEYEITVGVGSTTTRVYADFSAYPDDYLNDATVYFVDPLDSDNKIENYVKDQTSTYIDLCDTLSFSPSESDTIDVVKDNIKKSSLSFERVNGENVYDVVRVEFINREVIDENDDLKHTYQWDVVEYEYPEVYVERDIFGSLDLQKPLKIKTVRMSGIKRKSQAMRMAQFLGLYSRYSQWMCEFTTDIVGYQHAIGDIIGISHSITNWDMKYFKVVNMEEQETDEVKLTCIEYSTEPLIDEIDTVYATRQNVIESKYSDLGDVERLHVIQELDHTEGWYIYIHFKPPASGGTFFWGAQLWVKKGTADYEYLKTTTNTTQSVLLDGGISGGAGTVPYDPDTLYGTFPSSGLFYIDFELFSYSSISGDSFILDNRGMRETDNLAHLDQAVIHYQSDYTLMVPYTSSDIGVTWTFKMVSVSLSGIQADFATAPTDSVTLVDPTIVP
jgi:hypothetical protein